MRAEQSLWTEPAGWDGSNGGQADLCLVFGGTGPITDPKRWDELTERYPGAILIGCSTGGEIHGTDVLDESLSVTALSFEHTTLRSAEAILEKTGSSLAAGDILGKSLDGKDLRAIFILSDGLRVNGSELVRGVRSATGPDVVITGGLAGDGPRFANTYVGLNELPRSGRIAAIGFYGDAIKIGHGSAGGWDAFGPRRLISRSEGNVLFELDGKPALELYKRYLGDDAKELPGSALLFPLRVSPPDRPTESLTRTIVGVDEEHNAMIFAGDVPQGYSAQLMRGNFDRLIEGAADAARQAHLAETQPSVAVLVSCIGRKLLLGQRIYEEIEAVQDVLGAGIPLTGFYSYGEVSPHIATHCAELHNQTMTITIFSESKRA